MSPHYPMFSYPSNPTTGIVVTRHEEPLDLTVNKALVVNISPRPENRVNLEEKLNTLLSYYDSLSKENSLLRAQENELLTEIQAVRSALLLPSSNDQQSNDYACCTPEDPGLDLRFAVSEGFKERSSYVKRRQSSLSTINSSSSSCSTYSSSYSTCSSEEDSPNESKMNILVVKKKKKMEQNKLASRRFRERKKASWGQTVLEADRLEAINKELTGKANELELKIKWIKEALRKNSSNNHHQTNSISLPVQ